MKIIIQENGLGLNEFDIFMDSIKEMNIDYQVVKVVPFSHEVIPEVEETDSEIIPFGTIFLSKIGEERGWKVYYNENFDQRIWTEKYKGNILNEDVRYYKMKDLPEDVDGDVFIRPVLDWKLFAGHVRVGSEIREWKKGYIGNNWDSDMVWDNVLEQTVSMASPKKITAEMRFAVVNSKVVTGSYYRINGEYIIERVEDQDMYNWVQSMVDIWKPIDTFVFDVAITPDGEKKVIEVGTINACGFYDMDIKEILKSIVKSGRKNNV